MLVCLAMLYCMGATLSSNYPLLPGTIECAAGTDHDNDRLSPDPDLHHIDDQVPQPEVLLSVMEPFEFKHGLNPTSFIPGFTGSVWQPPKTC